MKVSKFLSVLGFIIGPIGLAMNIVSVALLFSGLPAWAVAIIITGEVLVFALVAIIMSSYQIKSEKPAALSESNGLIAKHLYDVLKKAYNAKKYKTVVLYGNCLERPLYLSGRLEERIAIGRLVASAAKESGDNEEMAKTLIDMIGWTLFLIGGSDDEVIATINQGINNTNDLLLKAKGHRHLTAIYACKGKYAQTENENKEIESLLERVTDSVEKQKFIGGFYYGKADIACYRGLLDEADYYCMESKKIREKVNDPTREIRWIGQKGKIEYFKGDAYKANSFFAEGLGRAIALDRIDEIVKNKYGMALCLAKTKPLKAVKMVKEIKKEFKHVYLSPLDEIIVKKYEEIIKH